jgi:hypothetical protein
MGLGAYEPLEATGELYLIVLRDVHDLVGKVVGNVVPKGQRRGAPEPGSLGRVFLCPGLGWRC